MSGFIIFHKLFTLLGQIKNHTFDLSAYKRQNSELFEKFIRFAHL